MKVDHVCVNRVSFMMKKPANLHYISIIDYRLQILIARQNRMVCGALHTTVII